MEGPKKPSMTLYRKP